MSGGIKVLLIGGTSHVGKSTIAKHLAKKSKQPEVSASVLAAGAGALAGGGTTAGCRGDLCRELNDHSDIAVRSCALIGDANRVGARRNGQDESR